MSRTDPARAHDTAGSRQTFIEIEHDGVAHRVALKRVATARRFTLRVRLARGEVVLTLPTRSSAQAAKAFASRHAAWIAERVSRAGVRTGFAVDSLIPVRGRPHRVTYRAGLRRRAWIEQDEVDAGARLCVSGPAGQLNETIEAFLRTEARRDLVDAVQRHAATVGKTVRGLTLRDTRSRWGSCSSRGTLNFSWRLILAPSFVLDYLAAHEVAHLVHLNHSPAFWSVTKAIAPRLDEAEAWLKTHGPGLHRYGP